MKQKTFILFCLCFIFSSAFTQKKELQVTVSDTMMIQADNFVLKVSASQNPVYDNPDTSEMRKPNYYNNARIKQIEFQKSLITKIETKMSNVGFEVVPKNLRDFQNYADYSTPSITFRIYGKDSLTAFIDTIIANKNLNLNFITVQTNKIEYYQQLLLKKLIAKAKKEAAYLASLSGNKITSVISLSENNYMFANNMFNPNFFQGISLTEKDVQRISTQYMIQNSITIKFSLE